VLLCVSAFAKGFGGQVCVPAFAEAATAGKSVVKNLHEALCNDIPVIASHELHELSRMNQFV
jgi:hypothetical protein